jgi:hypothetical protein
VAIKAQELGSAEAVKRSLKGGGGQGWLSRPQEGSTTVRFLTEPDAWVMYWEVFSEDLNHYIPLEEGEDDGDAKKRYLTNAFLPDEQRVVPLVLPVSAVSSLMKKFDRYGTILDREYIIDRSGSGFDTEYDVDSGSKSKFNVAKYEDEMFDLLDVLEAQLTGDDVDDDDEDDEDEPPRRPTKGRKPTKKATRKKKTASRSSTGKKPVKGKATKPSSKPVRKKAKRRKQ